MNRDKQRGMSALGLLIVLLTIGFVVWTGFKIVPLYWNDWSIERSLSKIDADELRELSKYELRSKIGKHFDIDRIETVSAQDVKIERKRSRVILTLDYETRVEFLGNLDVVARFNHTIDSNAPQK